MEEVSREKFYQTISNWNDVPFSQQEGWITMQSGGRAERVKYFIDNNIACAAHVKTFGTIRMLMIDSECLRYNDNKPATWCHFYEQLRASGYQIVEVNSRRQYIPQCEVGMRQAGYLRPLGSFSYELTSVIDLTQPLRYNNNWQRNLKKTEEYALQLEILPSTPYEKDIADFIRIYEEMCRNKQLSVPFTTDSLLSLLADNHFELYFVTTAVGERVSGIVIHRNNTHAGLIYAANSNKATAFHAGFAMYKLLLTHLAQIGIKTFDMEKMGASAHSTNSVFNFKNGIHGDLKALCGEWSWYKHKWLALGMYFVKKYLWHKQQA